MFFDEIKKSVKQKYEDYHSNPFMSSFIIAWIIINHKYLLILVGEEKLENKLRLLNMYYHQHKVIEILNIKVWSNELLYPLMFALGYVFIYPILQIIFDTVTLGFKMVSIYIKDQISGIDSKERKIKEYLKQINLLKEEKEDLLNEKRSAKENIRLLKEEHERQIDEKAKELNRKEDLINEASIRIDTKDNVITRLQEEIDENKNKLKESEKERKKLEEEIGKMKNINNLKETTKELQKIKFPPLNPQLMKYPFVKVSKVEIPKVEIPKVEIPKVEIPKVEIPKVEIPKVEIPKVEIPKVEIPEIYLDGYK